MSSTPTITYSFQILHLNVIPNFKLNDDVTLTNVVSSVIFNYVALRISDNRQYIITNEIPLDPPTTSTNYKEYHSLTEEEIISWLISNEELVKRLKYQIDTYFDDNQIKTLRLPWATNLPQ